MQTHFLDDQFQLVVMVGDVLWMRNSDSGDGGEGVDGSGSGVMVVWMW